MRELVLGQVALALDAVHDLHAFIAEVAAGVGDPAEQAAGLVGARGDP